MKINLVLFVSSFKEQTTPKLMIKTIESDIRPIKGDIIDDPGFDSSFHNGYEVVKVSINYTSSECFVSLHPLAIELEDIKLDTYIEKLEAHGWLTVSKEELQNI
ncbi:hypothetical protein COL05_15395 [Bacillus sp. AFS059628]|uniref:hypothetical protein n=1 Tax=Bacillus sp. AFS059628 TaxID=2033508 RepID=UPI000BF9B360|nr:hypothetical protein [Bacillus sp. AFS059628]PFV80130.1 hypothetical protein COL05_15395 [Bacillus sp. AFS059628]